MLHNESLSSLALRESTLESPLKPSGQAVNIQTCSANSMYDGPGGDGGLQATPYAFSFSRIDDGPDHGRLDLIAPWTSLQRCEEMTVGSRPLPDQSMAQPTGRASEDDVPPWGSCLIRSSAHGDLLKFKFRRTPIKTRRTGLEYLSLRRTRMRQETERGGQETACLCRDRRASIKSYLGQRRERAAVATSPGDDAVQKIPSGDCLACPRTSEAKVYSLAVYRKNDTVQTTLSRMVWASRPSAPRKTLEE
jgi:hypothetical protein